MPSSVVSHYRLIDPLGSGGMGVVYRAEDTSLGRTVALKFLPPQITHDAKRMERFRDEARTASSLNHPNICTIYEVGEQDGELFIAMEYVDGAPLSEFLKGSGVPTESVLRFGKQIASALEHAHERGVVHRDLKPVNVIVTSQGNAKILDFGLAKRSDPSDVHRSTMQMSPTDTTVGLAGTLPYMSPEQLEGMEANARSDIWSLGVVLFEMTMGTRPFHGENLYKLCTAILQAPTPPMADSVPVGLQTVIRRCLEKEPARRYQRASEVRAALEALEPSGAVSSGAIPDPPKTAAERKFPTWAIAGVAGILLAATLVGIATRVSSKGEKVASAAPLVPERAQLAVLPPTGATTPEQAAFDNGLTETLTARLGDLNGRHPLAVIPASEVRAKNVKTLEDARDTFGVNLALMLNVQHAAGKERVNFALVDVKTHEQLRGGTITEDDANPFALQDSVWESVAQSLELELEPQEKQTLEAHGTNEPAAYDFYLQGRGYLQDFGKIEDVESAITVFQRAIDKDPKFAAGYAGLGEAKWRKFELTHDTRMTAEAKRACEQAVKHDDALSQAHVCLGMVDEGTGQYTQAVTEFQRAAQLEPTLDSAQAGLGKAYESLNRPEEAERAYKAAISLLPNYWESYNRLGNFYLNHGRYDDASAMYTQVIQLAPDSFIGYNNLGIARLQQGHYGDAISPLQRSIEIRKTADATSNLSTAYFQTKRYEEAARLAKDAVDLDPNDYQLWGNLGDAYYWAPGQRANAPAAYEKAIQLGERVKKVNPHDANMLSYLAQYKAMVGRQVEARRDLAEALHLAPQTPEIWYYAAMVYTQQGETKEAVNALKKAVELGYSKMTIRDTPNFAVLGANPEFGALLTGNSTEKGK